MMDNHTVLVASEPSRQSPGFQRIVIRCRERSRRREKLDGKTFVGGDHVSIADIRLACSLEFLNAIDYPFAGWTKAYTAAVEKALGDAYAEPAGDVRGYIQYVKGK